VKELVGDQADVIVSMPEGADPHEWEPSAKHIEAINKADLVVENGLELESGMLNALDNARNTGVKFFTASNYITIRYVGEGEIAEEEHEHEHEDEEEHEHHHEVGAPDPHLWTDPLAMKSIAAALADTLQNELGLDVSEQAASLGSRLDSLDEEIVGIVSQIPAEQRKLVTGHESMGYFSQRYGFKLVGVIIPGLTSQGAVSAADLAELKEAITENGVTAIFTELGTSTAVAQAISDETGASVVELPSHTLPEDGSYLTFMRNLANVISNALA
jgi:zinc/manganese transport system substrate-binding protein